MSRFLHRWFAAFIMLAGTGWVVYLLVLSMDDPRRYLPANGLELTLATLLIAASFATNWFLFYSFLMASGSHNCSVLESIRLQTAGQLLRYLPGRVWGVIYQISAARGQIPAGRVARANLDLMVFSLTGSVAVACLILGAWTDTKNLYLISTGLLIFTGQATLFMGGADRLLSIFSARMPGKLRGVLAAMSQAPLGLPRFLVMQAAFILGWLLYLYGWSRLGSVFPAFEDVDFILLSVFYTLASVVGILSVITPAGLGVREAAFLFMTINSTEQEVAAFVAVFGRVWLMLIELLLLLLIQVTSLLARRNK
jgi:uncharacterized membrane protein YbhN (UPF0104 family)